MFFLNMKIFYYRVRLFFLVTGNGMIDRALGPITLFKYDPPKYLKTTTVRFWEKDGPCFVYTPILYRWGRKRIGWFNYYRAKPAWYTTEYPHLVIEYCTVDKLKELHDRREQALRNIMVSVEKLNTITTDLNAKSGKLSA